MTPSSNTLTSVHTLTSAPAPDPQGQIELTPDPRVAAYLADLDAALSAPLGDDRTPFSTFVSRMKRGLEGAVQDPAQAHRRQWRDLDECADWILEHQRIGPKHEQPCLHTGIGRWPGDTHKANCAGVQSFYFDLDGAVHDADELDLVKTWARSKGCHIIHSSASHDPANGVWRIKILLRINRTLSYDEAARVARMLRQELADVLGRPLDNTIDPCTERAMQVQLVPAWKDESRKAQAFLEVFRGSCMDVAPYLAQVREEMAEEAKLEEAKAEARRVARPHAPAGGAAPTHDDGSVDRVAGARADLRKFPITVGRGERNKRLRVAASICLEWSLAHAQAEHLMLEVYGAQVDEGGWCGRWVSTIYSKPDTEGRRGRRLGAAQTRARLAVGGELDLDGGPHTAIKREEGRYVDHPVSGPHNPCAPAGGGPHNSPAANLPSGLRSIGGIPVVLVHMRHLPIMAHIGDQRPKLLGVRSPCGTGKSFAVRLAIHRALAAGDRVVVVVPRRSLARALAADLGLPCYLDQVGDIDGSTVVCLDSVHRVTPYRFDGREVLQAPIGLLVLDEVQQLVRHAFGGTLKKKRGIDRCWAAMRQLCGVATKIRASDAGLDPLAAHILRAWVGPEATAEILDNTYRPSAPVDTFIRRSETSWMREVGKEISKGRKIWIYFTSKRACKAIAKRLQSQNPSKKVLVIHSEKTSGEAKECLQDTRKFAEWDIVCCTGSVGTGVSVEHVETWSVFGHLTATKAGRGPIAPDVYQGLSRVRSPLENRWHLCLLGRGQQTSDDPAEHLADLLRLTADTRARLDGITDFEPKFGVSGKIEMVPENGELLRAYCQVLGYEGRYGGNYHDSIRDDGTRVDGALRRYWADLGVGAVIELDTIDEANALARTPAQAAEVKEAEKDLKVARKEVDADDDVKVATAREVTHEEAEKLEAGEDRTPEICAQITNERLRRRYDVDHLTPEDVSWDRKNWGHAVYFGNAYLWQQGERQGLLAGDAKAGGCSLHWRHTHQGSELLAALWKKCGISDFEADAQAGVSIKSPGAILQSRIIREGLRRVLGMEFKAEDLADGMSLVRSLARRCGLKLKSTRPRGTGARKRVYTLDVTQVQELLAKTSAYRARIKDPKRAPEVYVGPTAEETAAFLAALVADEDFIKIKRAA